MKSIIFLLLLVSIILERPTLLVQSVPIQITVNQRTSECFYEELTKRYDWNIYYYYYYLIFFCAGNVLLY